MRICGAVVVACTLFAGSGCGGETPRLAALGSGDLSNALTARRSPDRELKAACNEGRAAKVSAALERAPYLQRVTASSARVLFWADSERKPELLLWAAGSAQSRRVTPGRAAGVITPEGVEQFEARFDELAPDTLYCYTVDGLTEPLGFRTAPANPGDAARFVAFGDSGTGSVYQRALAAEMQTVPYGFALHLGDLAYESGARAELESNFFGVYGSLTQSFAVYPVAGNHDYRTQAAAPLLEAFSLPDNAPHGRRERFYSFDWGAAHLVGLDTENMDAVQLAWLERDLSQNAGRWSIVFGHRPLYSSGEAGGNAALRAALTPIFERHSVKLVLAGHEHDYERTRPIDGVTYFVSGGGGRGTRPVSRSSFTAYSESVLHFLFIEATPRALVVHAIDGTGREFDGTRITRQVAEN